MNFWGVYMTIKQGCSRRRQSNLIKCLCELKCGKASGFDGIEPEQLLYAHLS